MEPKWRISRKHGRQTGTARCDRSPGRGVCLSIHRVQKTSPHFQQWYFLLKWSKGVEHTHSLIFRSVFQSSATDPNSVASCSTLIISVALLHNLVESPGNPLLEEWCIFSCTKLPGDTPSSLHFSYRYLLSNIMPLRPSMVPSIGRVGKFLLLSPYSASCCFKKFILCTQTSK